MNAQQLAAIVDKMRAEVVALHPDKRIFAIIAFDKEQTYQDHHVIEVGDDGFLLTEYDHDDEDERADPFWAWLRERGTDLMVFCYEPDGDYRTPPSAFIMSTARWFQWMGYQERIPFRGMFYTSREDGFGIIPPIEVGMLALGSPDGLGGMDMELIEALLDWMEWQARDDVEDNRRNLVALCRKTIPFIEAIQRNPTDAAVFESFLTLMETEGLSVVKAMEGSNYEGIGTPPPTSMFEAGLVKMRAMLAVMKKRPDVDPMSLPSFGGTIEYLN